MTLDGIPVYTIQFCTNKTIGKLIRSSLFLKAVLFYVPATCHAFPGSEAIKTWNARQGYTDEEIVDAIYMAEGGSDATYLYGIRSVPYDTPEEARRICFNTVRNNRRRYAEYGHKTFDTYLEFLASRYAPVGASNDPRNLNANWLKNVKYFLKRASNE